MKALVVSDSHGLTKELDMIVKRHMTEVDFMLHCGDSELESTSSELSPFLGVKGNCDFGSDLPNDVISDLGELSFLMAHGHLYDVKSTLMRLNYRAAELGVNLVFFGHSHIAGAELINDILFINPGSIRLPVMRRQKTYAMISVEKREVTVTFYEVNGEVVEELSKTVTL
ncbi:metallophosphoesterase [Bacillus weihaiensis]|uniref:Phosphoesterase n=1 Tax=Bacillus weihaiensis TaxID=1547283 RepID=A0A1L3MPA8_9BACI|nr:metallophosphoesterase [Bacillus weihaiensis]APH04185.1 YfcE family phosphodiesterase [Bacillus weihaiensis]